MKIDNMSPADIEKESMRIIGEELSERGISLPEKEASVIKRCIHATADFDYAKTLVFSPGALDILKSLICGGADIVTDTNMALSGINKRELERHGTHIHCYMADESVAAEAAQTGRTRASVSMERAILQGHKTIFVIGNAPTALITLHRRYIEEDYRPAFIIGVPVGFVNVVYAKELILDSDIPYIINRGRKGGSTVAAAIVNAVLYSVRDSLL